MTAAGGAGDEPGTEFWNSLSDAERTALRAVGTIRRWPRREVIFHEGSAPDLVLVVLSGRVKVSSNAGNGAETVLAVRGPGALLGELGAIDRRPRSAMVQALEDVAGLALSPDRFRAYLQEQPRTALLLLGTVIDRLRDADRKRGEFGSKDATQRVAARLVELTERFGSRSTEGHRVSLPVSQGELASWTGASRAAVNKALSALRRRGWVTTGRMNIIVHDLAALRDYAEHG